ncbi:MAG: tetratricopeptide repeat protein [Desulfovibrionaceae bacterium]
MDDLRELLEKAAAEQRMGRPEQARELCRRVLAQSPDEPDALRLLGALALREGRFSRAVSLLSRAAEQDADNAHLQLHLGMALEGAGQMAEAVEAYKNSMGLNPSLAEPYVRFGNLLKDNGQPREALACYAAALKRDPDHYATLINTGTVLMEMGRGHDAVQLSRRALKLRPDAPAALFNLAASLHDAWNTEEAGLLLEKLIKAHPESVRAMNNLAVIRRDQGCAREAVSMFRKAWQAEPAFAAAHSNYLLTRHYLADEPLDTYLAEARAFGAAHADELTARAPRHSKGLEPERPLRIGYISGDFRSHAVSCFFAPVLAAQAAGENEIFCYSNNPHDDAMTEQLRGHCANWREVRGLSDVEAAERIRQDSVDILVDLSGHSAHNRLLVLARKPAPVQAVWLGYFDSTGLNGMDYLLADGLVCPEGAESRYAEEVVRLPGSFWCYGPPDLDLVPALLPALERGNVTFGCFNNTAKLNEHVVDAWAEILRQVPGAELILQSGSFADTFVRARYQKLFEERGVDSLRVVYRPQMKMREYLACHHEVDLALDPFPYGGGATSADALWMGVPVLTLRGQRFEGRMTWSQLAAVNKAPGPDLEVLATDSVQDYIRTAVDLATNLPRLGELRQGLRERLLASPFCDAHGFVCGLDAACREMWRAHCRKAG